VVAAGVLVVGLALALVLVNVFNVGRSLELHKKGLRFVEGGSAIDLLWEDIADVQVHRSDATNLGLVTVHRRGAHYAGPGGPLTRTDWDVVIHARDGRTVHLDARFLKMVPDVRKLISQLRLRAGI
jgi:hypothetical protein